MRKRSGKEEEEEESDDDNDDTGNLAARSFLVRTLKSAV